MSKSAIWPIITIIIIIGFGLFVWGSAKNKNQSNNSNSSSSSTTAANEEYFSQTAKVMFFYSDYCGWCTKEEDEVLSKLGKEGYKVKPINADSQQDVFDKYQVTGTPAFIAPDGKKLEGFQDYNTLKAFLDKYK